MFISGDVEYQKLFIPSDVEYQKPCRLILEDRDGKMRFRLRVDFSKLPASQGSPPSLSLLRPAVSVRPGCHRVSFTTSASDSMRMVELDNGHLALLSSTGALTIWNLTTYKTQTFPESGVKDFAKAPNEQIYVVKADNAIVIWDFHSNKIQERQEATKLSAKIVHVYKKELVVLYGDKKIVHLGGKRQREFDGRPVLLHKSISSNILQVVLSNPKAPFFPSVYEYDIATQSLKYICDIETTQTSLFPVGDKDVVLFNSDTQNIGCFDGNTKCLTRHNLQGSKFRQPTGLQDERYAYIADDQRLVLSKQFWYSVATFTPKNEKLTCFLKLENCDLAIASTDTDESSIQIVHHSELTNNNIKFVERNKFLIKGKVISMLALPNDRLLLMMEDGGVQVWTRAGKKVFIDNRYKCSVKEAVPLQDGRFVTWSPDGRICIRGSYDHAGEIAERIRKLVDTPQSVHHLAATAKDCFVTTPLAGSEFTIE